MALEHAAIDRLGIKCLKIKCKADNLGSKRVAIKSGFVLSDSISLYNLLFSKEE